MVATPRAIGRTKGVAVFKITRVQVGLLAKMNVNAMKKDPKKTNFQRRVNAVIIKKIIARPQHLCIIQTTHIYSPK